MIHVEVAEPGIVVYRWIDTVTMKEAENTLNEVTTTLPCQPYVAVVDLTRLKRPPTELVHMRDNIQLEMAHGLKAYVIIGGNMPIGIFLRTIKRLALLDYHVEKDYTSAVCRARDILAAHVGISEPS